MLLTDLLRFRTRAHHHKEDFLSAALGALLQRDPLCRGPLLATFRGSPGIPNDLSRMLVRTQLRTTTARGETAIPDLALTIDAFHILVECKLDAPPDLEQLRKYARLGPNMVGLLARREALAAPGLERWPRAAWEDVWAALVQLEPSRDPVAQWLRDQLAALLAHLGLTAAVPLRRDELLRGAYAWQAVDTFTDDVRAAVQSLLAPGVVRFAGGKGSKRARWQSDGPLAAHWERSKATTGLPLLGLGLSGQVPEGGIGSQLRWTLEILPSKSLRKRLLRDDTEDDWERRDDWWALPLPDPARATRQFSTSLRAAVDDARDSLARLVHPERVGKALPAWSPARPTDLSAYQAELRVAQATSDAVSRWEDELVQRLLAALRAAAASSDGVEVCEGREYVNIHLPDKRWIALWVFWELSVDEPHIGVDVSWSHKRELRAQRPAVRRAWRASAGCKARKTSDGFEVRADLRNLTVEGAVSWLADNLSAALPLAWEPPAQPDGAEAAPGEAGA